MLKGRFAKKLQIVLILVVMISLMVPSQGLAQDEVPVDPPPATDPTSGGGSTDVIPSDPAPAGKAPADKPKSSSSTGADSSSGSDDDEDSSTPEPVAAQDVADVLKIGDPIWCPPGKSLGAAGCSEKFSTLTDAITYAHTHGSGTIFVEMGALAEGGAGYIVIDQDNFDDDNIKLSVLGGVDFTPGATYGLTIGRTTLDRPVQISHFWGPDFTGGVTLAHFIINENGPYHGLNILFSDNTVIKDVTINESDGEPVDSGAFFFPITDLGGTNGINVFDSYNLKLQDVTANSEDGGAGILIEESYLLDLNHVIATSDDPDLAGAVIANSYGSLKIYGDSVFSRSAGDGLMIESHSGPITLNHVTATLNGENGVWITNMGSDLDQAGDGSAALFEGEPQPTITIKNSYFSENNEMGLAIRHGFPVTLNNVTAEGNKMNGAMLFLANEMLLEDPTTTIPTMLTILNSHFNGNGSLLTDEGTACNPYVMEMVCTGLTAQVFGGKIRADNVEATYNYGGGMALVAVLSIGDELVNSKELLPVIDLVNVSNSTFANNGYFVPPESSIPLPFGALGGFGLVAESLGGNIVLNNVHADNNYGLGGLALSLGGNVTINNSSFDSNKIDAVGGVGPAEMNIGTGLYVLSNGKTLLNNVSLSNNGAFGGVILSNTATLQNVVAKNNPVAGVLLMPSTYSDGGLVTGKYTLICGEYSGNGVGVVVNSGFTDGVSQNVEPPTVAFNNVKFQNNLEDSFIGESFVLKNNPNYVCNTVPSLGDDNEGEEPEGGIDRWVWLYTPADSPIQVYPIPSGELPGQSVFVRGAHVDLLDEFGNPVGTLGGSYKLLFRLPEGLEIPDGYVLVIQYYDEATGTWVPVPTTIDGGYASTYVSQSGVYIVSLVPVS